MLNKIIEKKQVKCHLYWPKKEGQRLNLPDVGLTVEFVTAENYKNFSKRLFRYAAASLLNSLSFLLITIFFLSLLYESSNKSFMTKNAMHFLRVTDVESTKSREVIQFHYTQVCILNDNGNISLTMHLCTLEIHFTKKLHYKL